MLYAGQAKVRQLCDIGRDPPRLMAGEQLDLNHGGPLIATTTNSHAEHCLVDHGLKLISHAKQVSRTSITFNEISPIRVNAFSGRGTM
jgi:hypothetical protein